MRHNGPGGSVLHIMLSVELPEYISTTTLGTLEWCKWPPNHCPLHILSILIFLFVLCVRACVHADMYLFQYLVCLCLLFLHSFFFFFLASCLPWSCNPKHRIVSLDCWYSTFRICFAHRNHPFLKTIILQCHLRYSLPHSLSASPLHPFQSLQSQAPCPNLI